MAYRLEQGDLIIDGWEQGVAASPHKGIANIQNANISTQINEVMAQFARAQQTMTDTTATGTLGFVDTNHVSLSIPNTNNLFKGNWITVTGSSNTTQLPNGTYYVPPSTGTNFQLTNYYNAMNYTPATVAISSLVVGGGGSGGSASGNSGAGGGGAGGVRTGTASIQTGVAYTVTVGAGGSASVLSGGSIATVTADAGGNGGNGTSTSAGTGAAGASGGGGGAQTNDPSSLGTGGAGTAGEGHNGGSAVGNITIQGGAGGGGAGAVGADKVNIGNVGGGGAGGVGISSSISGSAVFYGGGGGGSSNNGSGFGPGAGGAGGGGAGGFNTGGVAGTANTGGGGGAGTAGAAGGSGIVIISVPAGTVTATGGTKTTVGGNDIWTFTSSGTWTPIILPITVPSILTGFTTGLTASFTMVATMGKPIAQATETYYASGVPYHRYYVLDNQNLVWVYDDQNEVLYSSTDNVKWFLPDKSTTWLGSGVATGIGVISGFLVAATNGGLFGKPVTALGNTNTQNTTWVAFPDSNGWDSSGYSVSIPHFCFVGHQGILYVTDASYIVSVFPDSTISDSTGSATADNVQSLGSWTIFNNSFEGEVNIISGTTLSTSDSKRVPVVLFTINNGVLPTAITAGTVYYMNTLADNIHFQIFSSSTSLSPLDIQTGASGPQYFSTFYPIAAGSDSLSSTPTYVFTSQRLTLPKFEIAQCMAEIGNQVLVGCAGSVVYPWDQVQNLPQGLINLPESNVANIITVNQMGYIFAGNKANIYITDGGQASQVLAVPDYCAGVPGTPSTYVEPQFSWGGAGYIRGRVYFSIQDQTSTKAGNCGGIWSFTPTQNLYIGQDIGISLRLENQNSYGTYSGYAPLIIARQNQVSGPPLFWSPWVSSVSSPIYGIDYTSLATAAGSVAVIETDAIPVGTFLEKKTFKQVEYKLSSPLLAGESVAIGYRGNLTDIFTPLANVFTESGTVSGYFSENTEKMQWLQLQVILTPATGSTGSFIRLREIRVR